MSRVLWVIVVSLWSAAVVWGLWKGFEYQSTAADRTIPPEKWPAECGIERDHQRATLLVFIHPKCPCSSATIRELENLLARHHERVAIHVIVLKPAGVSPEWEQTELLARVTALPNVQIVLDHEGIYRRLFRTTTSGECLLYDTAGRRVFHGGITPLRGHEGPSVGQAAIAALLLNRPTSVHTAPVFGCALETSAESPQVPQ